MAKIKVKQFGPIKDGSIESGEWIEIKKVTLFIGNQGTGKSTLAKIISTFTWIEKALTRGDYSERYFDGKRISQYLDYHNIISYVAHLKSLERINDDVISDSQLNFGDTAIEYQGDSYYIFWNGSETTLRKVAHTKYHLPKIMYMPSERTFLSYVYESRRSRGVPRALIELSYEFRKALTSIRGTMTLPLQGVEIGMSDHYEQAYLKGSDFTLALDAASSGFQSLAPLYVVSRSLALSVKRQSENSEEMNSDELERFREDIAAIHENPDFTEEQRRAAISVVAEKYNKSAFVNIVEEPEQNLFPSSQWQILKSLLEFNNMSIANKLIMTSHSPYIINYLMLAIKAKNVYNEVIKCKKTNLLNLIEQIVPLNSTLNSDDVAVYEINEFGKVIKLPDYNGLPSDENYLNQMLEKSNIMYSQLLDIEDQCL